MGLPVIRFDGPNVSRGRSAFATFTPNYTEMLRILILFLASPSLAAQSSFKHLFPDLSGAELLEEIQDAYAPSNVLTEELGKDLLYAEIDNQNDSVRCVYTGYQIYLDPDLDPSQGAFAQGINLEHTYPKSQLVNGPSERDLHHLFPTLADVNQRRGSLPFRELNDSQVDEWYINQQTFTSIPGNNVDAYSEYQSNIGFEPREDHKGNVARAMFYVFALYPGAADAPFFQQQRVTLCNWHFLDPADAAELERSNRVATYQGNDNPFVVDCTLPQRTFCDDQPQLCAPVAVLDPGAVLTDIRVFPQPFRGTARLRFALLEAGRVELTLLDARGRVLRQQPLGQRSPGVFYTPLDVSDYRGLAAYQLSVATSRGLVQRSGRLVVQ